MRVDACYTLTVDVVRQYELEGLRVLTLTHECVLQNDK